MEHPEPPTLALALQQLRATRGMTQEDLAERSRVSIRTISDIERGVSRLNQEYRTVIVLHHYLGLPLPDAAAAMGIPVGTAKSRLHRATQALLAIPAPDFETAWVWARFLLVFDGIFLVVALWVYEPLVAVD